METRTKIFGLPLVSIGAFPRGFISIGWMGRGVITVAQFGYGIVAITQFGFGIITISQFGFGLVTVAQGALGLILAIGQGALGFIANGLGAAGYYRLTGPGVWSRLPRLADMVLADPLPLCIWTASLALVFIFLIRQRDKFTMKMSIRDIFRSRKKHRDDRIRARAATALADQDELVHIVLDDPSSQVKLAALKNITDPEKLARIARETKSDEVADIVISMIGDPVLLFDSARSAGLPRVKTGAVSRLADADPSRLVELALTEDNQKVIQEIIDRIKDPAPLKKIIREASSPHAKIIALYNLENPDQSFLLDIIRTEKDISVCEAAVYGINDRDTLGGLIRGEFHTSVKIAAVEQIEDKNFLSQLNDTGLPAAIKKAIDHRIEEIRPMYYSMKIEFTCPFCSQPVFVNGPLKKASCRSCLHDTALPGPVWNAIREAGTGMTRLSSPQGMIVQKTRTAPACCACETALDADDVPSGSTAPLKCGSCGALNATFPFPGWLKWSKNAEQIFCAEAEGEESRIKSDMKPVAVSCIRCGAPLEITVDTPRNAACKYCNTVQYLPDPLWLSLHPVKIKLSWYIRCSFRERV